MELFGKDAPNATKWITGHKVAEGIEAMGRLETAAVAYHFFKDSGLKGRELFKAAEQMINDVMVDYHHSQQPNWIPQTGILGQAAGPLSTFATNFYSTTLLFMRDIAANPTKAKNYAPMAAHIAQTALWGGAMGMLFKAEVDIIIELLNKMGAGSMLKKAGLKSTDEPIPTLSEMILTADMPKEVEDYIGFGVVSGSTGMNLGASMSAPGAHAPSENTFPGIKLGSDIMKSLWNLGTRGTEADHKQALKTILPNMVSNYIDLMEESLGGFKEAGDVITNPAKRGKAMVELTEDRQVARMLGTRDLGEVRETTSIRSAKARDQHLNAIKPNLVDLAVDEILHGKGENDVAELAQRALELGMSPQNFMRNIKNTIEARQVPESQRIHGRMTTPAQRNRYEHMEKFRREDSR
jgi:hypothetical protein